MDDGAYTLFETPLGVCGIVWSELASGCAPLIVAFQLPEQTPALAERRVAQSSGARRKGPPPSVAEVIERVRRHLRGVVQDFRDITLDLRDLGSFERHVYAAAREIRAGQTRTDGELAESLGCPSAARAVGQALGRNPIPLIIPCHRVLAAGGKLGGFSAHGAQATKMRLLEIEGVALTPFRKTLSFNFDGGRNL
jgi:methylated-DNA-[protein]-cysteine S-methyltransferase